jgi:hypothetical protein
MDFFSRKSGCFLVLILLLILGLSVTAAAKTKAKVPAIDNEPKGSIALNLVRAKKNSLKFNNKQPGDTAIGDFTVKLVNVKSEPKNRPRIRVLADSILNIKFCLRPDSSSWISAGRQFTSPKNLSTCSVIKVKLRLNSTVDAILRFSLSDASGGNWNCTSPKYILGHTGDDTLTIMVPLGSLQQNADYGSQAGEEGAKIDLTQIAGYKFTVFAPIDEGEKCGEFTIKAVHAIP